MVHLSNRSFIIVQPSFLARSSFVGAGFSFFIHRGSFRHFIIIHSASFLYFFYSVLGRRATTELESVKKINLRSISLAFRMPPIESSFFSRHKHLTVNASHETCWISETPHPRRILDGVCLMSPGLCRPAVAACPAATPSERIAIDSLTRVQGSR